MRVMYEGTIRHRRFAVREHAFKHRITMAYVDPGDPPPRFKRADYLGDAVLEALAGHRIARLRILTMPGGFNPVSFYYCFDAGGAVRTLVAEVTNTPWGERHAYVLPAAGGRADKVHHVSPFMGMDHSYDVRATAPGETLSVRIASHREGRLAFDATLDLARRPYSRRRLAGASLRTLALIYSHALVLRLKGVPIHPHPRTEVS